jgi:hypothetical protein
MVNANQTPPPRLGAGTRLVWLVFVSSLGIIGPGDLLQALYTQTPSGFAHFRFSTLPVFGHRISCHDTGSIVPPTSAHY